MRTISASDRSAGDTNSRAFHVSVTAASTTSRSELKTGDMVFSASPSIRTAFKTFSLAFFLSAAQSGSAGFAALTKVASYLSRDSFVDKISYAATTFLNIFSESRPAFLSGCLQHALRQQRPPLPRV
jgi:hypothetical protein